MRLFLTLILVGLGLTLLGFAMMFGAMGGAVPIEAAFAGLAFGALIGPLTFISGFVVYVMRRPTTKELASQKSDDYRTWHFRPVGLLILAIGLVAFVALGNWAEQSIPGINSGRRPLSGYIFALVCLALLSFRKVRNLIFYTDETPKQKAGEDKSEVRAEPSAGAIRSVE